MTLLDEEPPEGYSQWNGRLLADQLGDTSDDQVWRVARQQPPAIPPHVAELPVAVSPAEL